MSLDASNAKVPITGEFYWNADGQAPAPSGLATDVTADYDGLGYISEDGVTLSYPDEGDTTPIHVWQNGATVRIIRTPSDDQPTFQMTFVETKLEVIEFAFGVSVERTAEAGVFVINSNTTRRHGKAVLDVLDLERGWSRRYYASNAIVTSVGEQNLASTALADYDVTVTADFDDELGGQIKVWDSALKLAAVARAKAPAKAAAAATD